MRKIFAIVLALMTVTFVTSVIFPAWAQTSTPSPIDSPSASSSSPALSVDSGGGGGGTSAVAINQMDGSDLFRIAFAIKRSMKDVVDNQNAAVAFASCSDCQTVAISLQVVLVMSDPSIVSPTNIALAYNFECNDCETMASAIQYVFSTGSQPVHFTAEGNRALAELRRELQDLRKSDLSLEEIKARMDDLIARLEQILATELVVAGKGGAPGPDGSTSPADTTGTGTPAPGGDPGSADSGTAPDGSSPAPTDVPSQPAGEVSPS